MGPTTNKCAEETMSVTCILFVQVTGYPEVYRLVYYGGIEHEIRKEVKYFEQQIVYLNCSNLAF